MSELRQPGRPGRRLVIGGLVSMVASVAIVAGLLARKVSLVRAEGRARAADVAAGAPRRVGPGPTPPGGPTPTPPGGGRAERNGRTHRWTPRTSQTPMPASAFKKKQIDK